MGLRIHTNVNALVALQNLTNTDKRQAHVLEQLSTGLRINRASDDPAGLVISEQIRTEIASPHRAVENSQDDSNVISTADAALGDMNDLLRQVRDPVNQAAPRTVSPRPVGLYSCGEVLAKRRRSDASRTLGVRCGRIHARTAGTLVSVAGTLVPAAGTAVPIAGTPSPSVGTPTRVGGRRHPNEVILALTP